MDTFLTGLQGLGPIRYRSPARGFVRPRSWERPARLAAVVCCRLALCLSLSAATLVHRPYLQNLHEDRVTIIWSARENLTGTVQYSTDRSFTQGVTASVRVFPPSVTRMSVTFYQYQAELTGLAPGTQYFYRVLMGAENITPESDYRFRTSSPGPFSFLVFGDSGAGTSAQTAITLRMVAEAPSFVVQVGDIAYEEGTFDQFQANYFEYYWSLMRRAPFFAVPGNHEYFTANAAPFLALHSLPSETVPAADRGRYYSFDWGAAHLVGLDSNLLSDRAASARMLEWLENDLTQSHARWRIAYFHHLPYPLSQHINDPLCIAARERLVPILERYGVQLVLTGHEHSYQRTKTLRGGSAVTAGLGTVYITTGGGGGVPHPVAVRDFLAKEATIYHYLRVEADSAQITVRAIGAEGQEFDRVTLTLPELAPGSAVVNAASFTPALAPGGLISIFGQTLADGTSQAAAVPLPTELSGSIVTLNGRPIPLSYASPTQINAQLPIGVQGSAILRVSTTNGTAETLVNISDTAPAIFPFAILHANGSRVDNTALARAGETLVMYLTGMGEVDGVIGTGQAAPASPLLKVAAPVEVLLDEVGISPAFAGLAPGFVGLYQINVTTPSDLKSKLYAVRVKVRGNLSNTVSIPVQGNALPGVF